MDHSVTMKHCVTLHHNGLTCKAGTLGSHGYVYIATYPKSAVNM
ncbi:type IV toxin-antitoxin system YeeU family antitoxin [Enterobacter asburiae]|nr:type IV toxin-antitoxin system YeeU family antitoxin [Enterobacter asburiae]